MVDRTEKCNMQKIFRILNEMGKIRSIIQMERWGCGTPPSKTKIKGEKH